MDLVHMWGAQWLTGAYPAPRAVESHSQRSGPPIAGETYLGVVPLGAVQPAPPLVPHAAHILELTHSRPHFAVRAYFHAARRRCMVAARHEEEERSEEQHRRQVRSGPRRGEFEVGREWLRRGEWLPGRSGGCGCVLGWLGGHGVKEPSSAAGV